VLQKERSKEHCVERRCQIGEQKGIGTILNPISDSKIDGIIH
jgi:hypothetical protein